MADSYVSVNGQSSLAVAVMNEVPVKGELLAGDLATGFRPVLLGGEVGAGIAQRTLVADARMVGWKMSADGRGLVLPYGPPEDAGLTTPVVALTNSDTVDFALVTARAAGIKIGLWAIEILNLSGTATSCILKSPSLGDLGRFSVPPSSGRFVGPFPTAIRSGAAEALNLRLTTAVAASSVYFTPFWFSTKQ